MRTRAFALLLFVVPLAGQPFTNGLWEEIRPIYSRTLEHPFLKGLSDGSLPKEHFRHYLIQDSLYLHTFGGALRVLASKAPRKDWALALARHAEDSLRAEREMHDKILASHGVTPRMAKRAKMAPTNAAYTGHLMTAAEKRGFTEGLAALLPCYWIYQEVGRELAKRGSKDRDYQRWIDQYSSDQYSTAVSEVLAMMNEAAVGASAAERESARQLFLVSALYEYLFWDMAWRGEGWRR